jgi:hypothetical protein
MGMTDTNTAISPYRRVTAAPISEAARANIRDNILPLYAKPDREPASAEPQGVTALYERLSQEDKNEGESNSIANQKRILERYCKERGYTPFRHYDEEACDIIEPNPRSLANSGFQGIWFILYYA